MQKAQRTKEYKQTSTNTKWKGSPKKEKQFEEYLKHNEVNDSLEQRDIMEIVKPENRKCSQNKGKGDENAIKAVLKYEIVFHVYGYF